MVRTGLGETFRRELRLMHRPAREGRPEDERVFLGFGRTRPSAYRRC